MIYKGSDYTIDLDLRSDLNQWAYRTLTEAGFSNVTPDRALHQYCNMQLRLLAVKPRKVAVSKELKIPEACRPGYDCFKSAVERGLPLRPFMSKSILDASFPDKMVFDWGFHHFHLSAKRADDDPRFMKRADYLLIAYIDLMQDDTVYFLQVRPHVSSVWTEQELVRILVDNWPDLMESRRLPGQAALTEKVTDADYKQLRKHNVNSMVDLHDGRVYLGANYGLNTAGTSVRATVQHDAYSNNAMLFEQAMGKAADEIGKTINRKLWKPESGFKLRMIKLGDRDYLFVVEGYGFLLRCLAKDDRLQIIVGDDEAQIEEARTAE